MCGELWGAWGLPMWVFPLWSRSRLKASISPAWHRQRGWALPRFAPQRSREICPSSSYPFFSRGLFCAWPPSRTLKDESLLSCLRALGLVPARVESGWDKCSCHASPHVLPERLRCPCHAGITLLHLQLPLSFASRRRVCKIPKFSPELS